MDDKDKQVFVVGVIAAVLGFGLLLLIFRGCGGSLGTLSQSEIGPKASPSSPVATRPPQPGSGSPTSHGTSSPGQGSSGVSGSHGTTGGGSVEQVVYPPPFMGPKGFANKNSEEEFNAMMARIQARSKEVEEKSMQWAINQLSNPALPQQDKEIYRLKVIEGIRLGHCALENGDPREALREYAKALKDPNASSCSKYLTYQYMMEAARQTQDIELYVQILRAHTELSETDDLSAIGVEKKVGLTEIMDERAALLRAMNSESALAEFVENKIKSLGLKENQKEEARKQLLESSREKVAKLARMFYGNKS